MSKIIAELTWRGLLKQVTNEEKISFAEKNNKAVYCGFDPTADSLHIGHLIQIMNLKRFENAGFKPIALIGGVTGMIGDPSFKNAERKLLTFDTIEKNVQSIKIQLKKIIPNIKMINNADWLKEISMPVFLRDIGKMFNISYLLKKENIASRIENGLSFTEFAYTLLQAYDFYNLYQKEDCFVQIGGSDQWGNITSGTDYISSMVGSDKSMASGITMHLITKKDGVKFGKTESGAVWLDENKTSVYEFYQFFINQSDDDSKNFIKLITFLDENKINEILKLHDQEPHKRHLQNEIANNITEFVHGKDKLAKAQNISKMLFEGKMLELEKEDLFSIYNSFEKFSIQKDLNIVDALVESKICTSKRDAREMLDSNSILVNDKKVTKDISLDKSFLLFNEFLIIKKGKKKYFFINFKN